MCVCVRTTNVRCIRFGHTVPVSNHVDVTIVQEEDTSIKYTWSDYKFGEFSDCTTLPTECAYMYPRSSVAAALRAARSSPVPMLHALTLIRAVRADMHRPLCLAHSLVCSLSLSVRTVGVNICASRQTAQPSADGLRSPSAHPLPISSPRVATAVTRRVSCYCNDGCRWPLPVCLPLCACPCVLDSQARPGHVHGVREHRRHARQADLPAQRHPSHSGPTRGGDQGRQLSDGPA